MEQPPEAQDVEYAPDDSVEEAAPLCVSFAHLPPAFSHIPTGPFFHLSCRYVYDYIGGEHSAVIPELGATIATFAITTLWLGPCDVVYLWSCLNCFGLNFELWVQKLAELEPLAQIEVSREGLGLGLAGALEWVALLTSGVFQPHLTLSSELSHRLPPCHQGYDSSCGCLALPYLLQGRGTWPSLC